MTLPLHSNLAPADCHPPKSVGFTGDPAQYIPPAGDILVLKTDVTPNQLYRTTGTTAGALEPVGPVGGPPIEIISDITWPPQNPPTYDDGNGLSFYIYRQDNYGSISFRVAIGVDSNGVNGGNNGWKEI